MNQLLRGVTPIAHGTTSTSMNIGPVEILIFLIVMAALFGIIYAAVRAGSRRR